MKNWTILLALLVTGAASAEEQFQAVRDAMKQLVPDIRIDSVRAAPINGFAEVLLGAQLIYVSVDGKYIVDGQLIEVATRKNLTESSKGEVRRKMIEAVPQDERLVFPANGERKYTVTIFTDIDCGYCRRLHAQMAEYNDLGIEIDYLFFPRAGLGSNSFTKAVSVWCADDKNMALTDAKAGTDPLPQDCPNPVESHYQLGREIGVTGTPAMLAEDGTLIPGYVPPATLMLKLDTLTPTR
jgi:thiol:disulfide interchange protein DsbC